MADDQERGVQDIQIDEDLVISRRFRDQLAAAQDDRGKIPLDEFAAAVITAIMHLEADLRGDPYRVKRADTSG
jgi:hypothetical protein